MEEAEVEYESNISQPTQTSEEHKTYDEYLKIKLEKLKKEDAEFWSKQKS